MVIGISIQKQGREKENTFVELNTNGILVHDMPMMLAIENSLMKFMNINID